MMVRIVLIDMCTGKEVVVNVNPSWTINQLVEELRRMEIVGSNAAVHFYKRDGGQEVPINSTAVQDLLTLQAAGAQILFESDECESPESNLESLRESTRRLEEMSESVEDEFESIDESIEKLKKLEELLESIEKLEKRKSALKLKKILMESLASLVIISLIIIFALMIYMIITNTIFRDIMFVIGTIIFIWYMRNMMNMIRKYRNY
jgi:hypothetical protein